MSTAPQPRPRPRSHGSDFVRTDLYERDREESTGDMRDIKTDLAEIRRSLEAIVPRSEHARVWADNDAHFSRIETRLTDLDTRLTNSSQRTDTRFLSNANQSTYYLLMLIVAIIGGLAGHFIH